LGDINFFKTLGMLSIIRDGLQPKDFSASAKKMTDLYAKYKDNGFKEVYKTDEGFIIRLLTWQASRAMFGQSTEWCTARADGMDTFDSYAKTGVLVVLKHGDNLIQGSHAPDEEYDGIQILNQRDDHVEPGDWLEVPDHFKETFASALGLSMTELRISMNPLDFFDSITGPDGDAPDLDDRSIVLLMSKNQEAVSALMQHKKYRPILQTADMLLQGAEFDQYWPKDMLAGVPHEKQLQMLKHIVASNHPEQMFTNFGEWLGHRVFDDAVYKEVAKTIDILPDSSSRMLGVRWVWYHQVNDFVKKAHTQ
jgi:hypothetical protein